MSQVRQTPKRHTAPFAGPSWQIAAAVLAIACVAQVTIVHYAAVRGVVPSLVLIAVVWYSIRAGTKRAAVYGLIAGVLEDVLSGQTGGAWTIATTATAIATSVLSRGFFADSVPLVSLMTLAATLLRALIFWTVMGFEGYPQGLGGLHFHQAALQALYNGVLMVVAMLAIRRFDLKQA